jgi:hypothetical protein
METPTRSHAPFMTIPSRSWSRRCDTELPYRANGVMYSTENEGISHYAPPTVLARLIAPPREVRPDAESSGTLFPAGAARNMLPADHISGFDDIGRLAECLDCAWRHPIPIDGLCLGAMR